MEDLRKEEIEFWIKRIPLEEVIEFTKTNRVEVLLGSDWQYQCYINYKKDDGCYGIGLTFIGALYSGIEAYKKENDRRRT